MLIITLIILYSTTATPSLRKDSPKTRKYRLGFTPTSEKIERTATGSTADIKLENRNISVAVRSLVRILDSDNSKLCL